MSCGMRLCGVSVARNRLIFSVSLRIYPSLSPTNDVAIFKRDRLTTLSPIVDDVALTTPVPLNGIRSLLSKGYFFEGSTALLAQNPAGVINNVDSFNWLTVGTSFFPHPSSTETSITNLPFSSCSNIHEGHPMDWSMGTSNRLEYSATDTTVFEQWVGDEKGEAGYRCWALVGH